MVVPAEEREAVSPVPMLTERRWLDFLDGSDLAQTNGDIQHVRRLLVFRDHVIPLLLPAVRQVVVPGILHESLRRQVEALETTFQTWDADEMVVRLLLAPAYGLADVVGPRRAVVALAVLDVFGVLRPFAAYRERIVSLFALQKVTAASKEFACQYFCEGSFDRSVIVLAVF
jgi:hypothetical protein